MLDLSLYSPIHRAELQALLASPQWQRVLQSGLVEAVRTDHLSPGKTRGFIDTVVNQLLAFNERTVRDEIHRGCRDLDYLFHLLATWPDRLAGKEPVLSFLGLNLTSDCNQHPKCTYCNQPEVASTVDLDGWKAIIEEVTAGEGEKPYIYLTGGEPLLLGEDLWGDDGLIPFATRRGAGVNINTNATLLTPELALRLIKCGLYRLHISLDTADEELHSQLRPGHPLRRVLEGIYNVQLARELVGVSYPVMHTNCVLTNRNLDRLPGLFAFILERHKQINDKADPLFNDLFLHVIPVGGPTNTALRPSEEEFRRFYQEVWTKVCAQWDEYQERIKVPKDQRGPLSGFFLNPFIRVEHKGGLDAYVKASAAGRYGRLALAKSCYVAPTQATFTPDGCQYRCGSHAIRRNLAIGSIAHRGVFDSIRSGMSGLSDLPQEEECYGCALATLYINQSVETRLNEKLKEMMK